MDMLGEAMAHGQLGLGKRLAWGAAMLALTLGPAQAQSHADAILKTMEHVADWELAHPAQAAFPANGAESTNPLGWVVGAFYTGLTSLADRCGLAPRLGLAGRGDRERLLNQALAIAARHPVHVIQGDLRYDLPSLASTAPHDATLVVFHTAVLAYVRDETPKTQ
jgi:hypothetical protein